MSKNMLSLEDIDGQTALELPERALLDTVTVTVGATVTADQSSSSSSNSQGGNESNIVLADFGDDHH